MRLLNGFGITKEQLEHLYRIAKGCEAYPNPCGLCGKQTYNRALYVPRTEGALGAPDGKWRVAVFPLCEHHPSDDPKLMMILDIESVEWTKDPETPVVRL